MPSEIPHTPAATSEGPREEPRPDTFTPQPPELQRDPDRTSATTDKAIRVEPTSESLREDLTVDQQEGGAQAVDTMTQGPQPEPETSEPNHVTAPTGVVWFFTHDM